MQELEACYPRNFTPGFLQGWCGFESRLGYGRTKKNAQKALAPPPLLEMRPRSICRSAHRRRPFSRRFTINYPEKVEVEIGGSKSVQLLPGEVSLIVKTSEAAAKG